MTERNSLIKELKTMVYGMSFCAFISLGIFIWGVCAAPFNYSSLILIAQSIIAIMVVIYSAKQLRILVKE
jgi:hypothetical protein